MIPEVVHLYYKQGWDRESSPTTIDWLRRILNTIARKDCTYEVCQAGTKFSIAVQTHEQGKPEQIQVVVNETGDDATLSVTLTRPAFARYRFNDATIFDLKTSGYHEHILSESDIMSFPEDEDGRVIIHHVFFINRAGDNLSKGFSDLIIEGRFN